MGKSVNIGLGNSKSLDNAIQMLQKFQQDLDTKTEEVMETIASTADAQYGIGVNSAPSGEGDDISHNYHQSSKADEHVHSYTIEATGRALFLEFGTGITKADSPTARADLVSSVGLVNHGEYGYKQGANKDGWYDPRHHKRTMGVDAQTPMHNTRKIVKEQLPKMMKEKFE